MILSQNAKAAGPVLQCNQKSHHTGMWGLIRAHQKRDKKESKINLNWLGIIYMALSLVGSNSEAVSAK